MLNSRIVRAKLEPKTDRIVTLFNQADLFILHRPRSATTATTTRLLAYLTDIRDLQRGLEGERDRESWRAEGQR